MLSHLREKYSLGKKQRRNAQLGRCPLRDDDVDDDDVDDDDDDDDVDDDVDDDDVERSLHC